MKRREVAFKARQKSPVMKPPNVKTILRELRGMFEIGGATLNTGVFCPKGQGSVWLFVGMDTKPGRDALQFFVDSQDPRASASRTIAGLG